MGPLPSLLRGPRAEGARWPRVAARGSWRSSDLDQSRTWGLTLTLALSHQCASPAPQRAVPCAFWDPAHPEWHQAAPCQLLLQQVPRNQGHAVRWCGWVKGPGGPIQTWEHGAGRTCLWSEPLPYSLSSLGNSLRPPRRPGSRTHPRLTPRLGWFHPGPSLDHFCTFPELLPNAA